MESLYKFADATMVGQPIRSAEDREKMQAALDGLVKWANQRGMAFNVEKCKVMHNGHANPLHEYSMDGKILAQRTWESLRPAISSLVDSGRRRQARARQS